MCPVLIRNLCISLLYPSIESACQSYITNTMRQEHLKTCQDTVTSLLGVLKGATEHISDHTQQHCKLIFEQTPTFLEKEMKANSEIIISDPGCVQRFQPKTSPRKLDPNKYCFLSKINERKEVIFCIAKEC